MTFSSSLLLFLNGFERGEGGFSGDADVGEGKYDAAEGGDVGEEHGRDLRDNERGQGVLRGEGNSRAGDVEGGADGGEGDVSVDMSSRGRYVVSIGGGSFSSGGGERRYGQFELGSRFLCLWSWLGICRRVFVRVFFRR